MMDGGRLRKVIAWGSAVRRRAPTTGPAVVRWPDLELRIDYDPTLNTVVVHTPISGVCVEPQTMWPNAPLLASRGVSGTGLRTLAPGERLHASHTWTWRPRDVR